MDKIEQLIGLLLRLGYRDFDFRTIARKIDNDSSVPALRILKSNLRGLISNLNRAIALIDSITGP